MNPFLLLLRRRLNEPAIAEDIEAHIAERTDDLIDQGVPVDEARARARREFGNVMLAKENSRDEWRMGWMEDCLLDLGYAVRSLRRNSGFALTVCLTLAFGIGANGAIFHLLHAIVVRTLPVPNAEQLRIAVPVVDGEPGEPIYSYPVFTEMLHQVQGKAALAGYSSFMDAQIGTGPGAGKQARVQLVTGSFFQTVGVASQYGRLLDTADDKATGPFPAVLSDKYWTTNFGKDLTVLGRRISLNGAPIVVAGVAPPGFFGLQPGRVPDYWLPVSAQHDIRYRENFWDSNGDVNKSFMLQTQIRWLGLVARIPDSHAEPFVLSQFNQIYARDMQREGKVQDPETRTKLHRTRLQLDSGAKGLDQLRSQFAKPLQVLMGAVGLVLLIASVNLASLSLARIAARSKEIAIRCSVGAGRGRIFRQLMAETAILSLAGAVASVPVAIWGSKILIHWASRGNLIPLEIGFDKPLLLFVVLSALLVGLLFGLLPALRGVRLSIGHTLKANSSTAKGTRMPWGRTLIAVQVTFSFVLVAGAVLFVRTLMNYSSVALGYMPQRVLSVQLDPLGAGYGVDQLPALYHRLLESIRTVPGVTSAALASCGLSGHRQHISSFQVPGVARRDMSIQENNVTPGYFQTVGMRLIAGRAFDWHDHGTKPNLAVVNKTAADEYFGGSKALGQFFGYGGDNHLFQIIGVVSDARVNDVHEPAPAFAYYSLAQAPVYIATMEVLTSSDPAALAQSVQKAIRKVDPNLPVTETQPLTRIIDGNLVRERLIARLASVFAILALALACLGVYGVLSYTIARRTSEIGIRLALGAEPGSVRSMILREAALVVAIGLVAGVPAAIALLRMVRGLLYGLTPADPASLTLSVVGLFLAGAAAALLPAWRASRVDPLVALRYE